MQILAEFHSGRTGVDGEVGVTDLLAFLGDFVNSTYVGCFVDNCVDRGTEVHGKTASMDEGAPISAEEYLLLFAENLYICFAVTYWTTLAWLVAISTDKGQIYASRNLAILLFVCLVMVPAHAGLAKRQPFPTSTGQDRGVGQGAPASSDDTNPEDSGTGAVNCQGSWGEWGTCSEDCGDGTRTRTYGVGVDAANGGEICEAPNGATETEACNSGACSERMDATVLAREERARVPLVAEDGPYVPGVAIDVSSSTTDWIGFYAEGADLEDTGAGAVNSQGLGPRKLQDVIGDACATGGITLTDGGDLDFDDGHGNNEDCQWTLVCSEAGARPTVTFATFNTEGNFDFVYIFDGNSTTDTQLAVLHGTSVPDPVEAVSGTTMLVQFTSDGSVTNDGFHATLSCNTGCTGLTAPAGGTLGTCSSDGTLAHGGQCATTCSATSEMLPMACRNGIVASPAQCCAGGTVWEHGEDGSDCTACGPGMYDGDSDPLTPCEDCAAGLFSDAEGATECAGVCTPGSLSESDQR